MKLLELVETHIRGTLPKEIVADITINLCSLSKKTQRVLNIKTEKVYVSSKVIKHIHEKRLAYEFDRIIFNFDEIVRKPDKIFLNHNSKRSAYLFLNRTYAVNRETPSVTSCHLPKGRIFSCVSPA